MSTTIVALLAIALIIAAVLYKKIPMQFVLIFVPIFAALLLGNDINKISMMSLRFLDNTMNSVGFMMLFGLMYFTMLSATGMFETIINVIMKPFKGNMNNWVVMILTTLVSAIAMITATPTTTYLIALPIMISLYDRTGFDKRVALVLMQTVIAAMCFLPWGQGVATSAVFAEVSPLKLSQDVIPISLCFVPIIVAQWIYFAFYMKKHTSQSDQIVASKKIQKQDGVSMKRPKLFWINLIIFVLVIYALAVLKYPSYLVFAAGALITTLIDYPKVADHRKLWSKASQTIFRILFMLIGISIFVGIFNGTGMTNGIAKTLVGIFPSQLTRYLSLILLALSVLVIRFLPYQLYNSLYPILISVEKFYGLTPTQVIAPYVTNLAFATGASPLTPATLVGTSLLDIDLNSYCNFALPIQFISNIAVILIGLAFGAIK